MSRLSALVVVAASVALCSCVQPYSRDEGVPVYVLADHFHSGILVQDGPAPSYTYTFYTFGDRRWYLEGRRDFWDGFNAALLTSDAVVAEGVLSTHADVRSVVDGARLQGEPNGWRFLVPRDALDRALEFVRSELIVDSSSPLSTGSYRGFGYTFYESRRPYTMFYSCVQFTAEFLSHAGIDFEPVWYFYTNDILRDRLNQVTDMVF
jgi:hypothetical protein